MKRRRIYIYVNGILNFPGQSQNWTGRAVTWTHLNTEAKAWAEKVEYWAGPITRVFKNAARAKKLRRTIAFYAGDGWDIVLVGHSNGCDVILDALPAAGWPRIEHIHFVCAAAEGNFQKNGLNRALHAGDVGGVTVYLAGQDAPLRLAHTLFGKALGYGALGATGPLDVAPEIQRLVRVHRWPDFGHSDCFEDDVFDRTMRLLTQP